MLALKEEKFILLTFFISSKRKPPTSFFKKFYYKSPGAFGIIVEITIDRALLHKPFLGSPDKPGGLSIQLCKSEKKEFYIRYSS